MYDYTDDPEHSPQAVRRAMPMRNAAEATAAHSYDGHGTVGDVYVSPGGEYSPRSGRAATPRRRGTATGAGAPSLPSAAVLTDSDPDSDDGDAGADSSGESAGRRSQGADSRAIRDSVANAYSDFRRLRPAGAGEGDGGAPKQPRPPTSSKWHTARTKMAPRSKLAGVVREVSLRDGLTAPRQPASRHRRHSPRAHQPSPTTSTRTHH